MVDNYIEVRSSVAGKTTKKLSEALLESFEGNKNYLHLGTPTGSGTGLVSGSNTQTLNRNSTGAMVLKYDDTLGHTNIPKGASYTSSTGKIILPKGSWILCATIQVSVGGTNGANSRSYHKLAINYGTSERHANSLYHRNSENATFFTSDVLGKTAGSLSVSGAVQSDGVTPVTIVVTSGTQHHSESNNTAITLSKAHLHAFTQLS